MVSATLENTEEHSTTHTSLQRSLLAMYIVQLPALPTGHYYCTPRARRHWLAWLSSRLERLGAMAARPL